MKSWVRHWIQSTPFRCVGVDGVIKAKFLYAIQLANQLASWSAIC